MSKKKAPQKEVSNLPAALDTSALYWKSPTFVRGLGVLKGEAKEKDVAVFMKQIAQVPGCKAEKFLSPDKPKQIEKREHGNNVLP